MVDTSNALVPMPENGVDTYRLSTNAATICGAIVKATAKAIQGRKYVCVEGWQAIAVAHGCAASACNVERVEGGFRATGQVRRMDTGAVIAEAEGFVGEDEPVWFGGTQGSKTYTKRPDFAIRAMAQTRAISRACRSAFAHVVILIDRSLGTTPAEEMQGVMDHGDTILLDVHGHPHKAAMLEREQARKEIERANNPPADWVSDARKDGLIKNNETRSQYQVDKVKKAIDNEWKVVNTTPKGQEDQLFAYLDMARNPNDVSAIVQANQSLITGASYEAEFEEAVDRLLRFFDKQAAPILQ